MSMRLLKYALYQGRLFAIEVRAAKHLMTRFVQKEHVPCRSACGHPMTTQAGELASVRIYSWEVSTDLPSDEHLGTTMLLWRIQIRYSCKNGTCSGKSYLATVRKRQQPS